MFTSNQLQPQWQPKNMKMMAREDVLAKLTANLVIKIIGEPRQEDINLLEQELAEKAAKIKTTEDVVKKGKKFGFSVVVL